MSTTIQNMREKLKRKLSLHDKNPNLDEASDPEDFDDETARHLHREYDSAETTNEPYGRSGSFLNKLIIHGNKKTEDQIAAEGVVKQQGTTASTRENVPPTTNTTSTST